jgi:F0F1-type ATP synthase membrane subunit b/b'
MILQGVRRSLLKHAYFLFRGGEIMSLETVEYVKKAEEKATKLELDSVSEIKSIKAEVQVVIEENKKKLSSELKDYEDIQQKEYDEKIASIKEDINKVITVEVEEMKQSVQMNKKNVVNDIVKEVVNRYGNS